MIKGFNSSQNLHKPRRTKTKQYRENFDNKAFPWDMPDALNKNKNISPSFRAYKRVKVYNAPYFSCNNDYVSFDGLSTGINDNKIIQFCTGKFLLAMFFTFNKNHFIFLD